MTAHEELQLAQISVSEMDNNVYLLHDQHEGLLIDAADDADAILALAERTGVTITMVLTTHRHSDHVRALPEVLDRTGAIHIASFLDTPALPAPVDVQLDQGDIVEFAGHELPAFVLRGHTPGGAGLAVRMGGIPHLFVGDSLFPGGLGKTASEGDFVRLFTDVTERLFDVYRDESVVHPGHGESTTLGAQRPHLDEWLQRRW
ncbi:MBL fold metallo-hydrolase [Corynebacterium uterequi]|uniref:Zn-dependent hydrolase, glyoxylase n=1 Tax=Corynebacterium uterequi TaxID=1072256 RepID=A0A0G3HC88_9CORY|nr:MBL fold metallo-hydrolase [Corynebacterium uterequi]AKK11001.1 Zn-dependent hydrolase, glyoxylase [Corynebacterium uterequi]